MDKTLTLKAKEFKQAIKTLQISLRMKKSEITRDSSIKRFEYTYELLWKCVKIYLSDQFGIESFSPKECFRELKKNQLLNERETELLLKMADDRNVIIHTYQKKFSEYLYKKIKNKYFGLIEKIFSMLQKP